MASKAGTKASSMNKNQTIITVAIVAVIVILAASFFVLSDKGKESGDTSIMGEWDLVSVYTGGWMDGYPIYGEDTFVDQKATISHYKDDFYIFDTGDEKLYCAWDGERMVTSGYGDSTNVVFMEKEGSGYLLVMYFEENNGVIELYKQKGYVGVFPGLSIPIDLPSVGSTIDAFKVRTYTSGDIVDRDLNSITVRGMDGRMFFYDIETEMGVSEYVAIYLGSGVFMSVGVYPQGNVYEMDQYRGGVYYCSALDYATGKTWVADYGDISSADYPDKDLSGSTYTGTEDFVIFKNGSIVEKKTGNIMNLEVQLQDDELLIIETADSSGMEITEWTVIVTDLRPAHHYGISVQSSVVYKGVTYEGWYFGYFDSKDCKELRIYGTLVGEDGSGIVISQKYTIDGTA